MISSLLLCCSTSRSGRPIQRHESLRGLLHHVSLSLSLSGSRRVSERLDREADSGSDWTMRRIAGRPKRLGRSQRRRNGKATGAGRTLILAALAWIGGGCCGGGCCGCWSPSAVTPLVNIDTSLSAPFICGCCCCCCCCCCCGTVAIAKAGAGLRALPNVQRPTRRASLVLLVLALLFLVVAVARRRIGSGIEVSPRASRDVLGARPSRRDGRRVAHTHTHTHRHTRTHQRSLLGARRGRRSERRRRLFFYLVAFVVVSLAALERHGRCGTTVCTRPATTTDDCRCGACGHWRAILRPGTSRPPDSCRGGREKQGNAILRSSWQPDSTNRNEQTKCFLFVTYLNMVPCCFWKQPYCRQ